MMTNVFREKLNEGLPTLGTHILTPHPDIFELVGTTGEFDYAEFVAEYCTFDMTQLDHLARAAQCHGLSLIIKLDQNNEGFWSQAAVGSGFHGVLFTDIRTPDDVKRCYEYLRPETPEAGGKMGVKTRRITLGAGYSSDNYLAQLEAVGFLIMIEKAEAVERLDEVLKVGEELGVDMTQWGPSDYSVSVGDPSLRSKPEIKPIEERVIKASLDHGIRPRIEISNPEDAPYYLDMGVKDFCVDSDRTILQTAYKRLGSGFRGVVETR